jgi:long-chain acyl-CoA synthetase
MLHDSAGEHADTSSLRLCVSGGAAMPVAVLRGFEEAFGCVILEGYGVPACPGEAQQPQA